MYQFLNDFLVVLYTSCVIDLRSNTPRTLIPLRPNLGVLHKAKHGDNRPEEDFERMLWGDLRVMFEPDVESEVWRSLQGYKIYPLTPITITNMLNKKLQADRWNEMVYQLLKLMVKQQIGKRSVWKHPPSDGKDFE
ncbi:hypothetical protein Tco_1273597 [Tanacetum coccineum]